jgi:ribosome maturation factor RimP
MFNQKLFNIVESSANPLGYEILDIECNQDGLIRIFIDRLDEDREVNLNDCELVTKQLLYLLPVENLSFERLEVSSPGIDRKLTKVKHFIRFIGSKIKIKLKTPLCGKKNFEGVLVEYSQKNLNATKKNFLVSIDNIVSKDIFCLECVDSNGIKNYLDFNLNELEQARLITDVSFKGRSS